MPPVERRSVLVEERLLAHDTRSLAVCSALTDQHLVWPRGLFVCHFSVLVSQTLEVLRVTHILGTVGGLFEFVIWKCLVPVENLLLLSRRAVWKQGRGGRFAQHACSVACQCRPWISRGRQAWGCSLVLAKLAELFVKVLLFIVNIVEIKRVESARSLRLPSESLRNPRILVFVLILILKIHFLAEKAARRLRGESRIDLLLSLQSLKLNSGVRWLILKALRWV